MQTYINTHKIVMVFLLIFLFSTNVNSQENNQEEEFLSIIRLIAAPEYFQNKVVTVRGYFKFEFENMSICFQENALSKECLWIEIDKGPYETIHDMIRYKDREEFFKKYNKKIIFVTGEFNVENTGHFGMYSGAIENISNIR